MKILGQISGQNLIDAWTIACTINFSKEVKSSYAPLRLEKWYRYSSNLQSVRNNRDKIIQQEDPHWRLIKLGDLFLPGWHSLLACKGILPESSTTIVEHRDHTHFEGVSVMLNLGEAIYYEQPNRKNLLSFAYTLTDGMLVEIDTKLLHSAEQISNTRYNFTFRRIKQEFLEKHNINF